MKARLPQGMGGGPGNMQAMIRQAQKMQEDAAALQQELEQTTYTATAGGGAVTATVTGKNEIVKLDIEPEVIDPDDKEMLCDLVTAAVNEAIRKAAADASSRMAQVTGGLNMPF